MRFQMYIARLLRHRTKNQKTRHFAFFKYNIYIEIYERQEIWALKN